MTVETLPIDVASERFVLGSILLDSSFIDDVRATLDISDFALEKHRTIYRRMLELHADGDAVDRVTVASLLSRTGEVDAVGGLAYLIDLDNGLPQLPNIDAYVKIVSEKGLLRRGIVSLQTLQARMMAAEPSAQVLADAQRIIGELNEKQEKHGDWKSPGDVIEEYPGGINAFLCPKHGGNGISTPWPGLTDTLAGLHKGDLFVLAGRPGMGKTIIAGQMALHVALQGELAAIFSLEMSNEALIRRMVCNLARVDAQKLRTGWLNREERQRAAEAAEKLAGIPLWLDDTNARTMPAITAALRKLTVKHGAPRLTLVDHLQLMSGINRKDQNRSTELGGICHASKHLAKELGTTWMLLSQLNRQCEIENRRPQKSDLRESGDIEQDADIVMFVHRPEVYAKNHDREDLRGHAEFIIAKQREGPVGKRNMVFLGKWQKFDSPASDTGELESVED